MKTSSPREAYPSLSFCCPEKLDNMTPADGGRYCGTCEKVVQDFSGMTNEAIAEHLLHSSPGNACGTFRAYQLQEPFNDRRDRLVGFYHRISTFGKRNYLRTVQLGLVTALLFLSGCHRRLSGYYQMPSKREMRKAQKFNEKKDKREIKKHEEKSQ